MQHTTPPSPPFKVVPQNIKHGVALLTTLIRGEGKGKVEDHENIIEGQMAYSVSYIFATHGSWMQAW